MWIINVFDLCLEDALGSCGDGHALWYCMRSKLARYNAVADWLLSTFDMTAALQQFKEHEEIGKALGI